LKGQVLAVRHSTTELGEGAGVEGGELTQASHHDSETTSPKPNSLVEVDFTTFSQNYGGVFLLFFFILHHLLSLFNIRNSFYQPLRTGLNSQQTRNPTPSLQLFQSIYSFFFVQLSSTTSFEYHGLPACGLFWSFKIHISYHLLAFFLFIYHTILVVSLVIPKTYSSLACFFTSRSLSFNAKQSLAISSVME
jgi:hypothetical protein